MCHCLLAQHFHGDVLIDEFRKSYLDAHDTNELKGDPPSAILNFVARLREEPVADSDSTADEGVRTKRHGKWPPGSRKCPMRPDWDAIAKLYQTFTGRYGTERLLVSLALGRSKSVPFEERVIDEHTGAVIAEVEARGYALGRRDGDREEVQSDFQYLGLLMQVADDPEIGIGDKSQGVRVGPGVPRLPALYKQKRRWRLPERMVSLDYLERSPDERLTCRRNYAPLEQWKEQVLAVMHDQASRGQMLVLLEAEARRKFPNLVVASLGGVRKDKTIGEVTSRVLFYGTQGLSVNRRTRIRVKNARPQPTFALSACLSEAQRQVPIPPQDWHYLGYKVTPGRTRSSTRWARSGSRPPHIIGLGSQGLLDGWHSTWSAIALPHDICWLLTTL